mgnify:CR=1 FL=1
MWVVRKSILMMKITFPDGSIREYENGTTGLQIAESISPRLAQDVLSIGVDGETWDLNRPISKDCSVKLYKFEDEEGKHTFWHTSAHLMAQAIHELYPNAKFGIGPAIENGFYYDIDFEGDVLKEHVLIKGNKYGIVLVLDPDVPFEDLLIEIGVRFDDSGKYFNQTTQ